MAQVNNPEGINQWTGKAKASVASAKKRVGAVVQTVGLRVRKEAPGRIERAKQAAIKFHRSPEGKLTEEVALGVGGALLLGGAGYAAGRLGVAAYKGAKAARAVRAAKAAADAAKSAKLAKQVANMTPAARKAMEARDAARTAKYADQLRKQIEKDDRFKILSKPSGLEAPSRYEGMKVVSSMTLKAPPLTPDKNGLPPKFIRELSRAVGKHKGSLRSYDDGLVEIEGYVKHDAAGIYKAALKASKDSRLKLLTIQNQSAEKWLKSYAGAR